MGASTTISWTDRTFNPWWGCTKVGPGCDGCYAAAFDHRLGWDHWGAGKPRRYFGDKHWNEPRRWNRNAAKRGVRYMVFCASMADVFDNEVDQQHRDRLWNLIRETPNLYWQIVTKRAGNIGKMLPPDWGDGYPNVWLIITVVNQEEADRDIPKLLKIPAAVRGLSIEPMIGPIDLTRICIVPKMPGSIRAGIHVDALAGRYCESGMVYNGEWDIAGDPPPDTDRRKIDWVICGGESEQRPHKARSMPLDWAVSLRKQCLAADVPFHMKQLSAADYPEAFADFSIFPTELRVRESPA